MEELYDYVTASKKDARLYQEYEVGSLGRVEQVSARRAKAWSAKSIARFQRWQVARSDLMALTLRRMTLELNWEGENR